MNDLSMQFSPVSDYFTPLRSRYSPQQPVLKYPQSMFFPYIRKQVSQLFKTIGKIIVLHILIFTFLDNRREDKRF
jgi:hypothetical protein